MKIMANVASMKRLKNVLEMKRLLIPINAKNWSIILIPLYKAMTTWLQKVPIIWNLSDL